MFRAGVIINAGHAVERLASIDTIIFDKTGTLTLPEPRLDNVGAFDPAVLETASRLALSSRHPLAVALAREAKDRVPFDGVSEMPGQGVCGTIDGAEARLGSPDYCGMAAHPVEPGTSVIAFSHASRTAVFRIRQSLRPDAVEVVQALRRRGFALQILSGDRPDAVAPVAARLGIATWQGGLKPADKIAAIDALKAQGRRVLMVGDGLNDAPALAAAHCSLSPVSAADLTQAQADAVFLGDRLRPVLDAIAIARRSRSLMTQNLVLAVIYNAIAVPVAVAGLLTPLIAAAAMSGSSILVTLNALRARSAGS
jgi:Cu2+-exporting ATPase